MNSLPNHHATCNHSVLVGTFQHLLHVAAIGADTNSGHAMLEASVAVVQHHEGVLNDEQYSKCEGTGQSQGTP